MRYRLEWDSDNHLWWATATRKDWRTYRGVWGVKQQFKPKRLLSAVWFLLRRGGLYG